LEGIHTMKDKTYFYIAKANATGGILQGEMRGKDYIDATHRLSKQITVPYTLQAMVDITLDKAIEECERMLRR